MSISKGGQSVKPYVGSKEVKEAYVGNQLVYRAVPPYNYAFLSGETSYVLADYVTVGPRISFPKVGGLFRMYMPGNEHLTLNQVIGNTIAINVMSGPHQGTITNRTIYIKFTNATGGLISNQEVVIPDGEYHAFSYSIPAGCSKIEINNTTEPNYINIYFDYIRYEGN